MGASSPKQLGGGTMAGPTRKLCVWRGGLMLAFPGEVQVHLPSTQRAPILGSLTAPWLLAVFLEKAAFLFGRNSVGVETPWDWAAGTHLVFIMGCRGTGRGKSAPSSILAAFHLAQHVVFIIECEGAGEGRPHKRVAFLLNKIKYSETKWGRHPELTYHYQSLTFFKLKTEPLGKKTKQNKKRQRTPANTFFFNPLARGQWDYKAKAIGSQS